MMFPNDSSKTNHKKSFMIPNNPGWNFVKFQGDIPLLVSIVSPRVMENHLKSQSFTSNKVPEWQRCCGFDAEKAALDGGDETIFGGNVWNRKFKGWPLFERGSDRIQFFGSHEPNFDRCILEQRNTNIVLDLNASLPLLWHIRDWGSPIIRGEKEGPKNGALFIRPRPVREYRIVIQPPNGFPNWDFFGCGLNLGFYNS